MQFSTCRKCGKDYKTWEKIDGYFRNLSRRGCCLTCLPRRSRKEEIAKKTKMTFRNVPPEQLMEIVADCGSISESLIRIGLKPSGANYATFHKYIKEYNIDTSHFSGQGHLKGKSHDWSIKKPIEEYLVENSGASRSNLRKRLIKDGIFEARCYKCNNTEWNGQPISLELEHINGIRDDNRLPNLTILCPNCHAQTPTYRGRNRGKNTNQ